jgi:hypothetical protein
MDSTDFHFVTEDTAVVAVCGPKNGTEDEWMLSDFALLYQLFSTVSNGVWLSGVDLKTHCQLRGCYGGILGSRVASYYRYGVGREYRRRDNRGDENVRIF